MSRVSRAPKSQGLPASTRAPRSTRWILSIRWEFMPNAESRSQPKEADIVKVSTAQPSSEQLTTTGTVVDL